MLLFILTTPTGVFAASTPSLSFASTYSILSSTYTNTSITTITGDVGFTTPPATAPLGVHTNYGSGAPYATAGGNQGSALSALALEACTFTFAGGPINLSTDTTHGPIGIYTPGVYCSSGAMDVAGPLTLNGSGTYIFRPVGALTSTAGAVMTLSGASPCDVFWTPTQATTLAANTTFFGTIIDDAGITIGNNTTWVGRALAFGGTVTTDTDTITAPTCVIPPPEIINTSMGGIYSVPWVTPVLSVTKIPTPQNLPLGPGEVTYAYTLKNPGTIPVLSITMTDDKCPNVIFTGGDLNNDTRLDTYETWTYVCRATLSQTTTNEIIARGISSNGIPALSRASVTVPVAIPNAIVLGTSTSIFLPTPTTQYPLLPNTGFPPQEKRWLINIFLVCMFIIPITIILTFRKKIYKY